MEVGQQTCRVLKPQFFAFHYIHACFCGGTISSNGLAAGKKDCTPDKKSESHNTCEILFDFILGTHPISRKGTTEIGGAKRRSAYVYLHTFPSFSNLIFSL